MAVVSTNTVRQDLGASRLYLVFATRSFLLLLYEVGGGGWRRSGPHAAYDSDAVLRERREAQLLALPHLDALQLLEAAQGEQNALPQQQEHLLHGEVRGVSAAELGDHPEEHDRNGLVVEKGRTCGGRRETGKSGNWRVRKLTFQVRVANTCCTLIG